MYKEFYSSEVIITYDNSIDITKLLVHALEVGCAVSLSDATRDEDGFLFNIFD